MPEAGTLFRKPLVNVSEHHAPQGKVTVTPERAQRWVAKFNKLRSEGYRFPECWGHQRTALPEPTTPDPSDDPVYLAALDEQAGRAARWNAGYIDRLEFDPARNVIDMIGTVPPGYRVDDASGDLINERDGTRIGEVSAGIATWKDGKGRLHPDIIIHAALTPLPVWANQGGFAPADPPSATLTAHVTGLYYLSTSGVLNMATDKDDDPDVIEEDEETDEPDFEEEPEPPAAPPPMNAKVQDFSDCIEMMGRMGLGLPPDIESKDFFGAFRIALYAYEAAGMRFCKPGEGDGDEAVEDADVKPAGGIDGATGNSPQAEMPPMLMSTATIREPALRRLALEKEKAVRKEITALWHKAKTKLGCPVAIADREARKATTITLSLNSLTGAVSTPGALRSARLVAEVLAAMKGGAGAVLQKHLATATEHANPVESAEVAEKADPEVAAALRNGAQAAMIVNGTNRIKTAK